MNLCQAGWRLCGRLWPFWIVRQYGIADSDAEFRAGYGRNSAEILRELLPDPTPDKIAVISVQKEAAFRALVQPGAVDML
jgi:hypothetical protein